MYQRELKVSWKAVKHTSKQFIFRQHTSYNLNQGCPTHRQHGAQVTKLCMVAPNVCKSSKWNLLHTILLALRILRWFWDFWETCASWLKTNLCPQCRQNKYPFQYIFTARCNWMSALFVSSSSFILFLFILHSSVHHYFAYNTT